MPKDLNKDTCQKMCVAAMAAMKATSDQCGLSDVEVPLYASYTGLTIGALFAEQYNLPLVDFLRQAKLAYEHFRGGRNG